MTVLTNEAVRIAIRRDTAFRAEAYDAVLDPFGCLADELHCVLSADVLSPAGARRIALAGGLYCGDESVAVLEGDVLTVLLNQNVVRLRVPDGELLSARQLALWGCGFAICRAGDGYLVHGELEVAMFDEQLEKLWSFSGRDIFVRPDGTPAFSLRDGVIRLYDFLLNEYCLDLNGRLL